MKRIVVVEEAARLRPGLASLMSLPPEQWEVIVASNELEALARLDEAPCAALIADTEGAHGDPTGMLDRVREKSPSTFRLVLVPAELQGAPGFAHGRIENSATPHDLVRRIARGTKVFERLHSPRLERLVSCIDALPSAPGLYAEFAELARSPTCTVEDLGTVISRDLGLTGKVLQIVNSPAFGLRRVIVNPGHAATFLGIDVLKSLVFAVEVIQKFDDSRLKHFRTEDVLAHGMRVASFTRAILTSESCGRDQIDAGFLAGMMHDCGRLILATSRADRLEAARILAHRDHLEEHALEQRLFGVSHAEVGARLLHDWNLPDEVVEAILYHHTPAQWLEPESTILTALHVANALAHVDLEDERAAPAIDHAHLESRGLAERLPRWVDACRTAALRAEAR